MTYTIEQYATLSAAIAQGALTVEYGDKKVTYRTQKEMLELQRIMATDLGLITNKNGGRRYATHSKDL